MIVGIAGVAGAGKDSFFSTVKEVVGDKQKVIKFSLADKLKEEVSDFCIKKYGIDPRNCNRKEKEKIRFLLVKYGQEKRLSSKGRYWIKQIEEEILKYKNSKTIAFVTDIRYCDYENDETYWLKHEMSGILVHVSKYEEDENNFKHFLRGTNDEERRNEPDLYMKADYNVEWPETEKPEVEEMMKKHAKKFLDWYEKKIKKPVDNHSKE